MGKYFDYLTLRGNPNMDPAIVESILRDRSMLSEQGSGWLSGWGGPSYYLTLSKLPVRERLVYAAVLEGYGDNASISDATGLSLSDVGYGLSALQSKGLVAE